VSPGVGSIRRRLARQASAAAAAKYAESEAEAAREDEEAKVSAGAAAARSVRARIDGAVRAAGCEDVKVGSLALGAVLASFGDVPLAAVVKQGSLDEVMKPVQREKILRALAVATGAAGAPPPAPPSAAPALAPPPTSATDGYVSASVATVTPSSPAPPRAAAREGAPATLLRPGAFVFLLAAGEASAPTFCQVLDVGAARRGEQWYKLSLFSELLPRTSADARLFAPRDAVLVERGARLVALPADAVAFDATLRLATCVNCVLPRAPPVALGDGVLRSVVDPVLDAHFYFALSLARRDGSAEQDERLVADATHCLQECLEADRVEVRLVFFVSPSAVRNFCFASPGRS
jgi:hypothetical protein